MPELPCRDLIVWVDRTAEEWRDVEYQDGAIPETGVGFYFRFLAPFHDTLIFDPERVLVQVKEGLRAFVGQTAFEEISRDWVIQQGKAGQLPFKPEIVGNHFNIDWFFNHSFSR